MEPIFAMLITDSQIQMMFLAYTGRSFPNYHIVISLDEEVTDLHAEEINYSWTHETNNVDHLPPQGPHPTASEVV